MFPKPFIEKNELFGTGSIKNVAEIIKINRFKRLLVITGNQSYQSSGLKKALEPQLKNTEYLIVNDFEVNPKYEDIKRIGKSLEAKKFDLIIAGGGGSAIDFAKCLNVYLSTKKNNDRDGIIDSSLLKGKFLPMMAIPTTAGTGSEATHFAVAYINKIKISIAHEALRPQYAIIDPVFCYASPRYISACCAFDAMCQAIESFWSKNATDNSKKFAEKAIQLISTNIVKAIQEDCHKARDNLSLGSFLAGKAINISKTTAPHALSYSLTSFFKIPHGHAVALTLGKFFTLNESYELQHSISKKIGLINHVNNLKEIKAHLGWHDQLSFEAQWQKLMLECGLEIKIPKENMPNVDLGDLIQSVNEERLSNHPVKITRKIISEVYAQLIN